ncbi:MAG: LLM class flavin-dependent oxidoreductase [Thermoleophilia bacterium]
MRLGFPGFTAGSKRTDPRPRSLWQVWPRAWGSTACGSAKSISIVEGRTPHPRLARTARCCHPSCWQLPRQRTQRIRIGFSVLLIQLHDPLRLAEEIATLDVLSHGRVNLGIARPGNPNYVEAFGSRRSGPHPPRHARQDVGVLVREAVPTTTAQNILAPRPSRSRTPIFVGGYTTATITWAASRGYPLMQHGIQSPASLLRCLHTYRKAGGDVARVPVGRFIHVAETDRLARAQTRETVQRLAHRLRRIGIHQRPGDLITTDEELNPENLYARTAIIGSPHTVRERITQLAEEHGLGYVNLLASFLGFLPEQHLRSSLSLFASEVAPTLAGFRPRPPTPVASRRHQRTTEHTAVPEPPGGRGHQAA